MKIVFNTDQIYLHGGIEKVMATKVNYWCNLPETEVYIVTTEQNNNPPCYSIDSKVKLLDLEVNYNRSKSYFSLENLKKSYIHFLRQKALFKELDADVIISPNFNFDHYWLPFIKRKSKLIKERHSSRYLECEERKHANLFTKIKFAFNDWIDGLYDKIVVLNADEAKYVKSNNAVVIPNPIVQTKLQADVTRKAVIAAGRIAPVKGFGQLIKAWSFVYKQAPDWELHIYGDNYGTTQQELEILIQQAGLSECVFFKGAVNNILQSMQKYSIYALSSVTECFPTVLLEALSVGLPVVSYDCPNGPRNIITDKKDGLLAENQNPIDLAEKLLNLISNLALRQEMSVQAKANYKRFLPEVVMQKWINLFK